MTRTHTRPLIAIPARFAATTSALRYAAEVNARALVEAVWRAGRRTGEPSTPPTRPEPTWPTRLARFDGVLLPGGGDLAPHRYGAADTHDSVYDVDDLQDAFDLEVARQRPGLGPAPARDLPRAAGRQRRPRRHAWNRTWAARTANTGTSCTRSRSSAAPCWNGPPAPRRRRPPATTTSASTASAPGSRSPRGPPTARWRGSNCLDTRGWFTAVQWHPEDTAHQDPAQQGLFDALVQAAHNRH